MVKILTKELKVSADKKYAVECSSMGSRPAAVITWWKDNKQITQVVQNVSIHLTLLESNKFFFLKRKASSIYILHF